MVNAVLIVIINSFIDNTVQCWAKMSSLIWNSKLKKITWYSAMSQYSCSQKYTGTNHQYVTYERSAQNRLVSIPIEKDRKYSASYHITVILSPHAAMWQQGYGRTDVLHNKTRDCNKTELLILSPSQQIYHHVYYFHAGVSGKVFPGPTTFGRQPSLQNYLFKSLM